MILRRYFKVLALQCRASMLSELQYRLDFSLNTLLQLVWTVAAFLPLFVVYQNRTSVGGWSWPDALVVLGVFTILKGLLEAFFQPSFYALMQSVRTGVLDFALMKPVEAQFYLSTAGLRLFQLSDCFVGFGLAAYGLSLSGTHLNALAVAEGLVSFVAAAVILYSLIILLATLTFRTDKLDFLAEILSSAYDIGRWPSTIFQGAWSFVFTFVLPIGVMTTFPALAILSRLAPQQLWIAVAMAAALFALSRYAWLRSLRLYASASS